MARQVLSCGLALGVMLLTGPVSAEQSGVDHRLDYVGLWEGMSLLEGTSAAVSIYPNPDGTLTSITLTQIRDPKLGPVCTGEGRDVIRSLYAMKKGRPELVNHTITCASGKVIKGTIPARLVFDRKFDLLRVFLGSSSEPINVLHRASSKGPG